MYERHRNETYQRSALIIEPVWCVVANVVDATLWSYDGQVRRSGTRHFSGGTTVYCLPAVLGNHYANVMVVGPHRRTLRYITVIMPSQHLTNWQVKLVECPQVVAELAAQPSAVSRWNSSAESRERAEQIVQLMRSQSYQH